MDTGDLGDATFERIGDGPIVVSRIADSERDFDGPGFVHRSGADFAGEIPTREAPEEVSKVSPMHSKTTELPVEVESDEMVLREVQWGDVNVGYETFNERVETDEMFAELPDGRCQSSHWGFVFEGRMTVRYANDEEETIEAGEAYYTEPGHNMTIEAGTTLIEFSPREQIEQTLSAAESNVT